MGLLTRSMPHLFEYCAQAVSSCLVLTCLSCAAVQVKHQGRSVPTGPQDTGQLQLQQQGHQEADGQGRGQGPGGWLRRQWPTVLLGGLFVWAVMRDRHRASAQPAQVSVRR